MNGLFRLIDKHTFWSPLLTTCTSSMGPQGPGLIVNYLSNFFNKENMKILTKDGNTREKFFVHLALSYCRTHKNATVAISVDAPQLHICLRSDSGCSRGTIDQRQLAKTAPFTYRSYQFRVNIHLKHKSQWLSPLWKYTT